MAQVTDYLEKLPFWGRLTPEEASFAMRNSAFRRAEEGALIYSRDCACVGLVFVISGRLRIYSLSPEGREITLFRLGPGEPCVLSASCVMRRVSFDTHMVAECDSELLVMNAEAFARLTDENVHARCFMFERTAQDFSSVLRTMESILFDSFDSRLAGFLLSEVGRTGSDTVRLTQSAIAEKVNSAREVVARMLSKFASEGLVETGRGCVKVKDKAGLEAKLGGE